MELNEPVENENAPSVTADLLLPLSNYTFTAGLEGRHKAVMQSVLSQIGFIWDFAQ